MAAENKSDFAINDSASLDSSHRRLAAAARPRAKCQSLGRLRIGRRISCVLADRPGAVVECIESNGKKAAFLREAIRVTNAPARVHMERVEKYTSGPVNSVDVVSARALAPLKVLCDQAFPLIERGAIGLFPKGLDVGSELTEAAKYWNIEATTVASKTSPDGCIVIVKGLKPL
jgi:16S rRNA (guanine527-N7)-methyltransferase